MHHNPTIFREISDSRIMTNSNVNSRGDLTKLATNTLQFTRTSNKLILLFWAEPEPSMGTGQLFRFVQRHNRHHKSTWCFEKHVSPKKMRIGKNN